MTKEHRYSATIEWTGNKGTGTSDYRSYERSHTIHIENKPDIAASSDPAFRGDKTKHNPEDLFLASLSSCHMLWYLHLCSEAGIVVVDYKDEAQGIMMEKEDGSGNFSSVILHPAVIVASAEMVEKANNIHHEANRLCFIANSCNFPVTHKPSCTIKK